MNAHTSYHYHFIIITIIIIINYYLLGSIMTYGACISAHYEAQAVDKGVCDKEFEALKECFKKIRLSRK